jgi:putative DNA primase/helicase
LLDHNNRISEHLYDQADPERCARTTIAKAREQSPDGVIYVVGGEIARIVDQAEAALIRAAVPVMSRASMLVQPITDTRPAADGGQTEVTVLARLDQSTLGYQLNKFAATFMRWNERKGDWTRTDPPGNVTKTLLSKGQWNLPKVTGVVTAPTLRVDGSVLFEPGYDDATQLWYAPAEALTMPPIGGSRAEAEAALALLKDLLAVQERSRQKCRVVRTHDSGAARRV